MKRSDVFLAAARLIESGEEEFSCHAIANAEFGPNTMFSATRKWYETWFRPKPKDHKDHPEYFRYAWLRCGQSDAEYRQLQYTFLAMAAAVSEAEE